MREPRPRFLPLRRGGRGDWRRRVKQLFPWAVVGILVLALALRLPFLTSRSLWFDETFSWRLSALFPSSEFFSRAAADVHPLLYYMLLWVWMLPARIPSWAGSVAGGPAVLDPEFTLFWMRLFSVFLGCATVATMMLAGRALFRSRWIAGAAGLLTAVNAFQLQYAWEARMYTLGTALLPLAMVGLARVVDARSSGRAWRAGLGFGLSLGALLHVHYYALFSWLALGAAKLLCFIWPHPARPQGSRGVGPTWLGRIRAVLRSENFRAAEVGFWLSVALFLPWLPVFLAQVARVEAAYWIPHLTVWSVPDTLARLFWGGVTPIPHFWAVTATIAAVALVAIPLARGRTKGDLIAAASFVIPLAASVAVSARTSVFLDRYFLFASLGLILLLARTVSLLHARKRTITLGAVAALGVLSIFQFWKQLDFPSHPGARGAASFLAAHAAPNEPVVVSSPFVYFPVAFHLGCGVSSGQCAEGRTVRLFSETGAFPHFAGAPILSPSDLVGPEVFDAHLPTPNPQPPTRVWVVDTTGFGGSSLSVPADCRQTDEQRFAEVFNYQGAVILRRYACGAR